MNALVRAARPEDAGPVRTVLTAAFPTEAEADLVEAVRREGDVQCELVAEAEGRIAGYILLSEMSLLADGTPLRAAGLAPIAVLPELQGQGIGGQLIGRALDEARAAGLQMVFVLGNPAYYGRFGFETRLAAPFLSPYAGEYFQAIALLEGFALPKTGIADYAPAFAALGG